MSAILAFVKTECPICSGRGIVIESGLDSKEYARTCECRIGRRADRRIERARVPRRYEHCSLESFETNFRNADRSLEAAHLTARKFVEGFPIETDGRGLLLTGSIGVGKTHLAVGILTALVRQKDARGVFYDYRELLKEIQNSYNPQVSATELEVLRPVFEAEVLVLDELGAVRPTDWVWDTVAHILNTRYNDKRTTIITTNYPNLPPSNVAGETRAKMREETLGDRIGERMRSRLMEMCVALDVRGEDFRQTVRRASFQ
jgi:DNA replication protein DnaC